MKENKRISLTQKGNKKALLLTYLVVLTASQEEKLNCEPLLPDIERIAKKFEIDWAVELSANVEYDTLAVSRVYETEIGECEFKYIENAAHGFLEAIDRLELPKPITEPKCPSHEENNEVNDTTMFVKTLLHDINLPKEDDDHIIGGQIMCKGPGQIMCKGPNDFPLPLPWGRISNNLLKEMCELYIKAHEQS